MESIFDRWWRVWGHVFAKDLPMDIAKDIAHRAWMASRMMPADLERCGNMTPADMEEFIKHRKLGKTVLVNDGKIIGIQG